MRFARRRDSMFPNKWHGLLNQKPTSPRHDGGRGLRRGGMGLRQRLEVLEDRTLLSFSQPINYAVGSNPSSVAVGDFNGDGTPDLATANSLSNDVSVLLGNGAGTFGTATNYAVGSAPQ